MLIAKEFDNNILIIEKDFEKNLCFIKINLTLQYSIKEINYDLITLNFNIDIDNAFNLYIQQNIQKVFNRLNANITKISNNHDELK